MPKAAAYTLAWSPSQEAYKLSESHNNVALDIVLESPAWFGWLAEVSSFAFSGQIGSYTARKETTQRGDRYWYAYLRTGQKLSKKYLGKITDLTMERLEEVAGVLQADRHQPKVNERSENGDGGAPPGKRHGLLNPLLATKLHMPLPRAQLVHRSHLTEQLAQGMAGAPPPPPAPPGLGKKTPLAPWLPEGSTPVPRLSLGSEDKKAVRFLSLFFAAF